MPSLTLGLEGVTIVLSIRGQPFTLTAPTARITASPGTGGGGSSGGSSSPSFDGNIYFKYEKPFEESLDLGTPGEVLAAIEELTAQLPTLPGSVSLAQQWTAITQRLQNVPVLDQAVDILLSTQVRLIHFEIGFVKVPLVSPTRYVTGFKLGLVFVPDPAQMPSLLGTTLTRFGAVVSVFGEATAQQIGLPD
ncbi:MAG: hypothetical protein KF788_09670 [Piscinibacter sp.]|nr:hypothetical protein [Piscinibacter sp.]